jgi:hypothetical protein
LNRKFIPYLILIVLAVLTIVVRKCRQADLPDPHPGTTTDVKPKRSSNDRESGFDRRISFIEYSNHAKCRMQCRKISQAEVEEIMQEGTINYNKSDLQNVRCPRYAVEGITEDNQKVRIVFAQCNEKTAVVTVIDLGTEWTCHCPGDDKKYDNKD